MRLPGGPLIRRLSILAGLALAAFLIACAAIALSGLNDRLGRADVAVILGNKVEDDGRASTRLAVRLDEAVALYRQGWFRHVIVSGAVGPNGYDEPRVMKAYLVRRGVPAEAVIMDSKGANTRLTAENSALIMKAHGFRSALVVSQYFHIPRCRLAFAQAGIAPVYGAHARFFSPRDLYSIPREVAGYAVYWLRRPAAGSRPSGRP